MISDGCARALASAGGRCFLSFWWCCLLLFRLLFSSPLLLFLLLFPLLLCVYLPLLLLLLLPLLLLLLLGSGPPEPLFWLRFLFFLALPPSLPLHIHFVVVVKIHVLLLAFASARHLFLLPSLSSLTQPTILRARPRNKTEEERPKKICICLPYSITHSPPSLPPPPQ